MGPFSVSHVLTFNDIVKQLRATFETFYRSANRKKLPLYDDRCRRAKEKIPKVGALGDAQTLFGVFRIPTDNHIRSLFDADEALAVNWCELTTRTEDGQVLYRSAFAGSDD